MGMGQTMLTIGAMMLLSLVIIRINNGFLTTSGTLLNSKIGVLAVSLATSMIEEASGKAFDENTDTTAVHQLSMLSNLGTDAGETADTLFDDFDDYNNFIKTIDIESSDRFTVKCKVDYINPSNPSVAVNQKTWHKKITVFITSPGMKNETRQDTVKISTVFSYWYFR